MAKDLYEILGVPKTASEAELKSAYRNLAKKYHPDLYSTKPEAEKKQAEARFKEINHAYDVLSDPAKRSSYDQYGTEDPAQAGGGWQQWSGGGFEDIINDFFGGGFGGSRKRDPRVNGDDITIQLNLTFEEAAFGVEKKVNITRIEKCGDCDGSGAKDPHSVKTCPKCGGHGQVTMVQQTIFGATRVNRTCPECGGKGKVFTEKCKTCHGGGTVKKTREVNINVPAGVDTNQVMNYHGQGHTGTNGGISGSLIVVISVKAHEYFKRKGSDLYIEVPISVYEASAGAKVSVPTLKESVILSVPAGTQSGEIFRMKGYGIKHVKKESYGDLYVTIQVEVPKNLNKKQLELLQKFQEALAENQYVNKYRFQRKIKK